jgi:hypothetical protein
MRINMPYNWNFSANFAGSRLYGISTKSVDVWDTGMNFFMASGNLSFIVDHTVGNRHCPTTFSENVWC